jgi:hypothetical protein
MMGTFSDRLKSIKFATHDLHFDGVFYHFQFEQKSFAKLELHIEIYF